MAKASKLEEYWRQNNVESLLKDVTHVLTQRMPADPAVAIVQHLQKKFPKSFKESHDDRTDLGAVPKITLNTSRSQLIASPRSDLGNESTADMQLLRQVSTQSQASSIGNGPSARSAFTNLLNQNNTSSSEAPEINLRNLVFASRISQQAVKLGKNIRSDQEILEEEARRPIKIYTRTTPASVVPTLDNLQTAQTHEQPSVQQLIKYKEQIHTEKNPQRHREILADLAKQAYEKEQLVISGPVPQPNKIPSQHAMSDDPALAAVPSETRDAKARHKPVVKSEAEQEVLNDENIFRPTRQRTRERHRNKPSTLRMDSTSHRQSIGYLGSRDRRGTIQGCVCKVCGNVITAEDLEGNVPPVTVEPIASSVASSEAAVDDWFQSSADSSDSKSMVSGTPDEITPTSTSGNPFQQELFRPIADDSVTETQHRPPSVAADSNSGTQWSKVIRLSESDTFARAASPYIRRPSFSRKTPSPVVINPPSARQSPRTTTHSSSPRLVSASPSAAALASSTERQPADWFVRDLASEEPKEN